MQDLINRFRQSASVKIFTIGFLILVLLIPLGMVRDTINERQHISQSASMEIYRTWGESQLVAGPVLILPYDHVHVKASGERFVRRSEMYVLPETLSIESQVETEIRYRGIHKVPVYTAGLKLTGRFSPIDIAELGIDATSIYWADAVLAIGISDGRAIAEMPAARINGKPAAFRPGGQRVTAAPPQIVTSVGGHLAAAANPSLSFDVSLRLKGSESLRFIPVGDTTSVSVTSDWANPSFSGNYLPVERSINETGFSASWQVSSIGRALPSRWSAANGNQPNMAPSAFGVDLYMPVSVYRLTFRATKYGVLFIVLTFVTYFLFETVSGLRLHPLQYLLVGSANTVFFLLLISLAEHTGFGLAYLASAFASSGLIVAYSHSVLGERRRAAIIGAVLTVLYVFLYMTLKAETYALLAGSLGVWTALALVMYLTRRIDWYGVAKSNRQRELPME